jgi:serine/threonine protein kinase
MAGGLVDHEGTQVGNYEVGPRLGSGKFGDVHQAVHLQLGTRVAVKILPLDQDDPIAMGKLEHEFRVHQTLSGNPGIVPLLDYAYDANSFYMFMEHCPSDLFTAVMDSSGLDEPQVREYAHQLLDTMELCHSNNIYHRDLKPDNLLLDQRGNLLLCDFGLATYAEPDTELKEVTGSPCYAAPEVLAAKSYRGAPCDIWSFGVVLFTCITCAFPFTCASPRCESFNSLSRGRFEFPDSVPSDLQDLLLRIWRVNPADRITLEQVRSHSWMTHNDMPCEEDQLMDEALFFAPSSPSYDATSLHYVPASIL